jgi:hypothetical protein
MGRWQLAQFSKRIGAMSLLKVTGLGLGSGIRASGLGIRGALVGRALAGDE